jgi:hypothetical protein
MSQIGDALYQVVLGNGETTLPQIQQWASQSELNMQEVANELKLALSTGKLYYKIKGVIVANPKKGGGVSQQAVPQQVQQPQRRNPFGGSGGYTPPGVGRMKI